MTKLSSRIVLTVAILSLGSAPCSDGPALAGLLPDTTYPSAAKSFALAGSRVALGACRVLVVFSRKACSLPARVSATAVDAEARLCSALGSADSSYNSRCGAWMYKYFPVRHDCSAVDWHGSLA